MNLKATLDDLQHNALRRLVEAQPEGSELARLAMEQLLALEADARAMADVRTLDGHNPNWHMALAPDGGRYCLPRGDALAFDGPIADVARREAAQWVRGQTSVPACTCIHVFDTHAITHGCPLHGVLPKACAARRA